jgi:ABC-2 type transport system permease protein
MNIFLRELKAHRKSLIIWSISMLFVVAAGMGKYAASSVAGQSINELIAQMPKSLQIIFGVGTFDLTKAMGFYAVLFMYLAVMAGIHASMLGANIISKEETDKTSEFLLVKPVSRDSIITSKLLASLANILILNIVTTITSMAIVNNYSKGEPVSGDILKLMLGMFIIQLIFLMIGAGIAAMSSHPKIAAPLSTGILLATFILSVAVDLDSKLDALKYVTPFKYYSAAGILIYDKGFNPVYLILSAVIVIGLLYGSYTIYRKRDMSI